MMRQTTTQSISFSDALTSRLSTLLSTWRRRAAERRALAGISNRALRDLGISQSAAEWEAAKPFWKE